MIVYGRGRRKKDLFRLIGIYGIICNGKPMNNCLCTSKRDFRERGVNL